MMEKWDTEWTWKRVIGTLLIVVALSIFLGTMMALALGVL